jgi:hypothetical protein
MDLGPKVGDAASLWNFTPSPGAAHRSRQTCGFSPRKPRVRAANQRAVAPARAGWTKDEVVALKLALEKFGIGRWVQIVDSGVLPGKLIQQLNGQTQRLLGQQSIAGALGGAQAVRSCRRRATDTLTARTAFTGLHVDVDAVRRDNEAKQGEDIVRKSGLIINTGGAPQHAAAGSALVSDLCRCFCTLADRGLLPRHDRQGNDGAVAPRKREKARPTPLGLLACWPLHAEKAA